MIILGCAEISRSVQALLSLKEADSPSKGKWMPLEVRHFRAAQENVLAGTGGNLFLLDLNLHNFGRVLDNLGDECLMARADFTEDAFVDPENSSCEPVPPEDTDSIEGALFAVVRF